jgi:guanylate kinase
LEIRIENATKELKEADKFKYRVVNSDLEAAYAEFKKIVEKELGNS